MKKVRLSDGRVIETEEKHAARLVRKFGARYVSEAAIRAPQERAVMARPQAR